jgi:hypothetical protein
MGKEFWVLRANHPQTIPLFLLFPKTDRFLRDRSWEKRRSCLKIELKTQQKLAVRFSYIKYGKILLICIKSIAME